MLDVKNERSRLNIFLFSSVLFSFQSIFLYTIFRTRVRVRVTRSHGQITSDDTITSYMTQERMWKDLEG